VAIVHPFSRVKTDRRHQKPRPFYFAQWILLCIRMWAQLTSRLENAHLRDSLSLFISVNILRYIRTQPAMPLLFIQIYESKSIVPFTAIFVVLLFVIVHITFLSRSTRRLLMSNILGLQCF
jgi:hypothetical protein